MVWEVWENMIMFWLSLDITAGYMMTTLSDMADSGYSNTWTEFANSRHVN
jgi:hypothetical protein